MQEAVHSILEQTPESEQADAPNLSVGSIRSDVLQSRFVSLVAFTVIACLLLGFYALPRAETNSSLPVEYIIDINKATEAELNLLPGVGPKMASEIVRYRTEHQGFRDLAELKNIRGIKELRYKGLIRHMQIDPESIPLPQVSTAMQIDHDTQPGLNHAR